MRSAVFHLCISRPLNRLSSFPFRRRPLPPSTGSRLCFVEMFGLSGTIVSCTSKVPPSALIPRFVHLDPDDRFFLC